MACGAPLAACTLAPAGDSVAAGGEDGRLHLWSFADGLRSEAMAPAAPSAICCLAAVPPEALPHAASAAQGVWHLAAGCEDGGIYLVGCRS